MTFTLRAVTTSVVLATAALSAQAGTLLVLPLQGTQSNSVQTFSKVSMLAFKAVDITVEAKGNATGSATDPAVFTFPVTKVAIGTKLNIASGSAVGSALFISRIDYDLPEEPVYGVTLANFTINYETKQVLADTTTTGGVTQTQMPLYNFNTATPLALKYQFPLTVTGHEVLDQLFLTPQAKAAFTDGLKLPVFAIPQLNNDFGTLTQDISTNLRKAAVSTKPYTP